MINVQGVLVDPTGNPLPNHEIRITTRVATTNVEEVTSTEYTDANGNYSFNLGEGWYYLEILLNDTYMCVGDLIVNDGTPTPIDLPDLLKYSDPVEVDTITYPPFWQNLIDVLENSPLTGSRTNRDQMVDTLVHVAEIKTTDVSDDELERKGTYDIDVKSCDAQVTKQILVYSDDVGNQLASKGSTVKTFTASSESSEIVTDEVNKSGNVTATDYTQNFTEAVTSTGSVLSNVKTYKTTISSKSQSIMDNNVNFTEEFTTSLGNYSHTVNMSDVVFIDEFTVTNGADVLTQGVSLEGKTYSSTVSSKVTSDTHTNDGVLSSKDIIVDNYSIGRIGNDTFEVDTVNDTVTIRGALKVTQLQDENGDPIDVSDGDTIFPVYQYSDAATGPWHDEPLASDYFRRENLSVNGVVDENEWGAGYQFKADTAVGTPGDTIYIEYQYSPDGSSSWTPTLEAGDAYRRERTVTNGIPGPWSAVAPIIGDDGDTIEVRIQYSVDGINNWHYTYVSGDKYERRARFINGTQDSAWSDPIALGSQGADGADGSDGSDGLPGLNGSGWYTIEGRSGVFPADSTATADFISNFGRSPQEDDHLFYVNSYTNTTASSGKRCITPIGGGTPVWNTPSAYFDGDVIVKGTVSGDRMIANTLTGNEINSQTTILAGSGSWTAGMNGYDGTTLPSWLGGGTNIYKDYRFWSGATDPDFANFSVNDLGQLKAYDARFRGKIELIGTGFMSISSGDGFGSANQFLEWTGPVSIDGNGNPIMSNITEGNAIKYFKTNGSAYFGGSLSAGIFRNAATNTQIGEYTYGISSVEIGPFGTNGNTKSVIVSHSLDAFQISNGSCPAVTPPSLGWRLERKIGGGAWTQVTTGSFSGQISCREEAGEAIINESLNASTTFTDTNTSTSNFSYRVIVTGQFRYLASGNVESQNLTVISTEE